MSKRLSITIFISGNGSNLQSIIEAIETNQINAGISTVISNNPLAFGLQRALKHNIKTRVIDHRLFDSRESFDQALLDCTNESKPDFIVLAGFMRILGSAFIQAFRNKILNIHPSLLPEYKGLNTHRRAIENRESEHGVSIHVVTPELDDGPVLLQAKYTIEAGDTVADLQAKGHKLEHQMYPRILKWLSEGRLTINHKDIVFDQKILKKPLEFDPSEPLSQNAMGPGHQ